ncbi:MAG: phage tail tape measure protein [Turicibacter sp.]|nr:phage tail tape measure protein [Turicibacter sp.]
MGLMESFSIAGRIAIEGADKAKGTLESLSATGGKVASNLNNSFDVMTKKSTTVLKWATGIGAGLAIYGKGALDMAGDYERTMNMVSHISGANAEEQKKLDAQAKEIASNTKFNANNIAEGYLSMSRAGLTATEQLGMMNGASSFAIITNKDLGESVDDLIKVNSMFGLGVEDTSHVMDVMTSSADKSTMTVDDMMQGLKYCGSTLSLYGNTVDMTAGTLAMLAKHGIDGTKAGTGLTQMFTELVSPSGQAQKVMEAYNLELYNSDGSMKNITQIADMLKGAFTGLSEEERNSALTTLFGAQSMKIATAMMDEGAEGIEGYMYTLDDLNYAQETANVLTQGWKGACEKLISTMETLQLTIGQKLQPLMEPLVNKISEILDKFRAWIDNGGDLFGIIEDIAIVVGAMCLPAIASLASGFVALMIPLAPLIALGALIVGLFEAWKHSSGLLHTVLGVLLGVVTGVTVAFGVAVGVMSKMGEIKQAIEAFKGLNAVFGLLKTGVGTLMGGLQSLWGVLMANPIIIVVAIVIALVAGFIYLWNHCEGFRNFFINMWENIKKVASAFWDWLKGVASSVWEAITGFFSSAWDKIKGVWEAVKPYFEAIWNGIVTAFKVYMNILITFWTTVWEVVKTVVTVVVTVILVILVTLWNGIAYGWNFIMDVCKAVWNFILDKIIMPEVERIKVVFEKLMTYFKNAWEFYKNIVLTVWNFVKTNIIEPVVNWIKEKIGAMVDYLKSRWENFKNKIQVIWNFIKTNIIEPVVNWIREKVTAVVEGIKSKFNSLKETVSTIFNNIKTTISNIFESVKATISNKIDGIKTKITGIWDKAKEISDKIKNAFADLFGKIKIPTFSMGGWTVKDLPKLPHISLSWNAEGGIFNEATIGGFANGSFQGFGESGAEAVIPLKPDVLAGIGKGISDQMGQGENSDLLRELITEVRELRKENAQMKVILDTGALVGQVVKPIDKGLQSNNRLANRGVTT